MINLGQYNQPLYTQFLLFRCWFSFKNLHERCLLQGYTNTQNGFVSVATLDLT